jgi:hypothetical protein
MTRFPERIPVVKGRISVNILVNGFSVLEKCDSGKFYHEDRERLLILNVD